jgi:hypothetical protein
VPISQIWTLQRASDGLEQTLAAWGITAATMTRRTQKSDTFEVTLAGTSFDAAEAFPYRTQVTLKRDGAVWFAGIATKTPRMGQPSAESVGYTFEGPWWYLDHIVYLQQWTFLEDVEYLADFDYFGVTPPSGPAPVAESISNQILGANYAGETVDDGAQIGDAIACAVAAGAPLQAGTIDPSLARVSEAARDLTCGEVIRRMLRWYPDCVTWFDYTTSPPTLYVRQRPNLSSVAFSVAGRPASALDVAARPDLIPSAVVFNYEIVSRVNDQDMRTLEQDIYPTGATVSQPGAIVMTFDLQGARQSYMRQYIKTAPIAQNNLAWFQERLPWLNDPNISNLDYAKNPGDPGANANNSANEGVITGVLDDGGADADAPGDGADPGTGSSSGGGCYDHYLVEGQIPNWLTSHAQMALVQLAVNYDVNQGNDDQGNPVVEHHVNELLTVKVMTTDLNSGWQSQLESAEVGDPLPVGYAEAYYNMLSVLQYEGGFEITEQECGTAGGPYLGKLLNLTGGALSEWATMQALIYETTEDLAQGSTRLRFGPVAYLGARDWLQQQLPNRAREGGDRVMRSNGTLTSSSHPVGGTGKYDRGDKGSQGPQKGTVWAGTPTGGNPGQYAVVVQPTTLDSGAVAQIPSNLTVRLRAIQVCVPGSGLQTMLVLCSETFTPPSGGGGG